MPKISLGYDSIEASALRCVPESLDAPNLLLQNGDRYIECSELSMGYSRDMERWLDAASLPAGNAENIMESCTPFTSALAKELAVEVPETNRQSVLDHLKMVAEMNEKDLQRMKEEEAAIHARAIENESSTSVVEDSLDSDSDRPFSSSSSSSEEGAAAEKEALSDSDWGDVSASVEETAATTRKTKRVQRKASSNIEDAFDWDDDSIWQDDSTSVKKEVSISKPPLPKAPKPVAVLREGIGGVASAKSAKEAVDDSDDWEDVPSAKPAKPVKKAVMEDDWEDVPSQPVKQPVVPVKKMAPVKPKEKPAREAMDDSDWEDVPSVPSHAVNPAKKAVVEDDWDDAPAKPAKEAKKAVMEDDWEDDWDDVPVQPAKKPVTPATVKPAAAEKESVSDSDWEDVPSKPLPPPPAKTAPNRNVAAEDWEDVPRTDAKPASRAVAEDWDDWEQPAPAVARAEASEAETLPSNPRLRRRRLAQLAAKSRAVKEAIGDSDDWEDVPVKPAKEVKKAVMEDDWEDVPSQPVKPVEKGAELVKEAIDDSDWEDVPPQPTKKPVAAAKKEEDWEDVPPAPSKKANEAGSDSDWEDVPPAKKSLSDDDWGEPPARVLARRHRALQPPPQQKPQPTTQPTPQPAKQQQQQKQNDLFGDLFENVDFSKVGEEVKPLSVAELLSLEKGRESGESEGEREEEEKKKRIDDCISHLPKLDFLHMNVEFPLFIS